MTNTPGVLFIPSAFINGMTSSKPSLSVEAASVLCLAGSSIHPLRVCLFLRLVGMSRASRSNYAQGFAQDLSSKNDPQLEAAFDGVRTSFDKPPVRRSETCCCIRAQASLAKHTRDLHLFCQVWTGHLRIKTSSCRTQLRPRFLKTSQQS